MNTQSSIWWLNRFCCANQDDDSYKQFFFFRFLHLSIYFWFHFLRIYFFLAEFIFIFYFTLIHIRINSFFSSLHNNYIQHIYLISFSSFVFTWIFWEREKKGLNRFRFSWKYITNVFTLLPKNKKNELL